MGVKRTDPTTNKCPEPEMFKCSTGDDNTENHSTCLLPNQEWKELIEQGQMTELVYKN